MKWNRESCLLVGLVVLLALSIMSCTGSGSGSPTTYTLSGTLTKVHATVPDGVFAYVKLVVHLGQGDAEALYWAKSSPFVSGVGTYSITGIVGGSYTGYAFIDTNGDAAGDGTSMPDNIGDWTTDGGGDLIIDSDKIFDLPDDAWVYTGA